MRSCSPFPKRKPTRTLVRPGPKRAALLAGSFASSLFLVSVARAGNEGDAKQATALFDQAQAALQRGDLAAACAKFAASQALDARVGTLANVARCEEKAGRLVAALRHWHEAEALADRTHDNRASVARGQATRLAARVPRITVRAPAGAEVVLLGADGAADAPLPVGEPVPLDPGTHRVRIRAAAHADREHSLTLKEGEQKTVDLPLGASLAPSGATPAEAGDTTPAPALRTVGFVVGAVGIAGLGVGGALGAVALAKRGAAEDHCDDANFCDDEGLVLRRDAISAATVSTVAFVAGAAATGAGLTLVLLAPSTPPAAETGEPTASVALRLVPGGLGLRGRW